MTGPKLFFLAGVVSPGKRTSMVTERVHYSTTTPVKSKTRLRPVTDSHMIDMKIANTGRSENVFGKAR